MKFYRADSPQKSNTAGKVKTMRMASIVVRACTFCFVMLQTDTAATMPIPVTLTELGNGGFSFTFDPTNFEGEDSESSCAWACEEHGSQIVGQLTTFKENIKGNIVAPVEYEENYVPEEEHPEEPDGLELDGEEDDEDGDEEPEEEGPEEPQEQPKAPVTPPAAAADIAALKARLGVKAGVPAASGISLGGVAAKVAEAPRPEFTESDWRKNFPKGYEPTHKDGPKINTPEHAAAKAWYDGLTDGQKTLVGEWPKARMRNDVTIFWRKSAEFAKFAGLSNTVTV